MKRSNLRRSGKIFEAIARPILEQNGYKVSYQSVAGSGLGGGAHKADAIIETPDKREIIVSLKWQQVPGTAEEKVPFEVIKLVNAIHSNSQRFRYAYLVLGGQGWKPQLKQFYLLGGLNNYIKGSELIRLVALEAFISRANLHEL